MRKALLDTSAYLDIQRARNHWRKPWASNTLLNYRAYLAEHGRPTVSTATIFELIEGLHRSGSTENLEKFRRAVLPNLDIQHPTLRAVETAAAIYAELEAKRLRIGIHDSYIASIAICEDLVLVTSNVAHFDRLLAAGFPLEVTNWRERMLA